MPGARPPGRRLSVESHPTGSNWYSDALRPDELARLARRTEGWAAGLRLFHLATRGKPRDERLRILANLGPSSRFVRDYLARNVVAELPDELREFLVRTSVLRRLSGPLRDALLERLGSRALLEELERRSVFTVALDDEGTFRYHEVLRSHLEVMLVAAEGEAAARAQARRAGELLVADGAVAEALAAFSRAEDWSAVNRLLERHGARLVDGHGAWIEALPPALLVQDPWLTLAMARRHRAEGRWTQALGAYAGAEALFGTGDSGARVPARTRRPRRLARPASGARHGLDGLAAGRGGPGTARASGPDLHEPDRPRRVGRPGPAGSGTGALGLLFIGTATGTRTAQLSVASDAGPPEAVQLIAAVGVSLLRLDPPQGPAGFVTIATGEGVPANAPVVLTWSVGITPTPLEPIFSDAAGALTAQALVLPGDIEGPRKLRAVVTLFGVPATPATAPFLVVAGTAEPPVSAWSRSSATRWASRSPCAGEQARLDRAPARRVGYAARQQDDGGERERDDLPEVRHAERRGGRVLWRLRRVPRVRRRGSRADRAHPARDRGKSQRGSGSWA